MSVRGQVARFFEEVCGEESAVEGSVVVLVFGIAVLLDHGLGCMVDGVLLRAAVVLCKRSAKSVEVLLAYRSRSTGCVVCIDEDHGRGGERPCVSSDEACRCVGGEVGVCR